MSVPLNWQSLDQNGKIIVEYVWVGGHGVDIRSKCCTVQRDTIPQPDELDEWNYDGSNTFQAIVENSEVFIRPKKVIRWPLRGGMNCIALCDTYNFKGLPTNTNFRHDALQIFDACADQEPWFSFEQEYIIMKTNPEMPIGFSSGGIRQQQGPYHCGNGAQNAFGRQITDDHYAACRHANLAISGTNAESFPGQWEYQMGPCLGIDSGDSMILSRFLLQRVAESYGYDITLQPKPFMGEWNGSGAHCNYSTKATRAPMGRSVIDDYIESLKKRALFHIACYGQGNIARLTGNCETESWQVFRSGVADREASIRIPRHVDIEGCGYLEDRRPSSNCDPYVVSAMIADTTLNEGRASDNLVNRYQSWIKQDAMNKNSASRGNKINRH